MINAKLNIGRAGAGRRFELPTDLVTRTQAILAIKGAGKTYTAIVQMEEMLAAGQQCVAIDPTGVWWGLRAGANGRSRGLPVIILGGDHGDVPLDPAAGEIVAEWLVEAGQSAVLDLSAFESNAAQDRFATAFAERLYRRKATAAARTPLHIFLDEADSFAPQRPLPGQQRMLGAWEAIVRRGRSRGLGLTLITQRPAVLSKNVLTQSELLTCLRIVSPQDRKAVLDWVNVHGDVERREQMMRGLASLPRGTAWFWSPGWLDLFERVEIRRRRTYDSSVTPGTGETPIRPRKLAPVDLAVLSERIKASAEAVEANDPKKLRAEVARLRAEVARLEGQTGGPDEVEVALRIAKSVRASIVERDAEWARVVDSCRKAVEESIRRVVAPPETGTVVLPEAAPVVKKPARIIPTSIPADGELNAYQRDLLAVLLDRSPVPTPRGQLGALAGRSIKSSAFGPNLRALIDRSLVEANGRGYVATSAALAACPDHRPAPRSGRAALDHWLGKLPAYEASLLRAIADAGRALTSDEIADRAGRSTGSSAFRPALRNLVDLEHVEQAGDRYVLGTAFRA
ncbi:MAG: hypothetical protein PVJ57_17585 [Phycisphaerae bacterium]